MRKAVTPVRKISALSAFCLLPSAFCLVLSATAGEAPPTPAPDRPSAETLPNAAETQIKQGRECFAKREYARALAYFERALTYGPDRTTQYLAGIAAYWARDHKRAMTYFDALLEKAARDSEDEWRIESARVMTFSAQGEHDAAEAVAQRLYELRRKLPQTPATSGFVREHFFLNAMEGDAKEPRRYRVGAWEVIDPRGESPDLWTFPIVALEGAEERVIRTLRVEITSLPGGGPGYALSEDEGPAKKVYKYWVQRPEYSAVRAVARKVFIGEQQPLQDEKRSAANAAQPNPANPPTQAAPAPAPIPAPVTPTVRVFSQKDLDSAAKIASWGLPPSVAQILTLSVRLKDVEFDVTKLTRAALNDPKDAERVLEELRKSAPFAPEDAAELVELIAKVKTEDLALASENLAKLGARKPYLDYALLTAFNTRGKDVPVFFLRETLQSNDALVRQTAALLLARYGERAALEILFKDLAAADALGCMMIHGWLEELLGSVLPPAPPPVRDGNPPGLDAWKAKAATFWKERGPHLKHTPEPKPGDPYWK